MADRTAAALRVARLMLVVSILAYIFAMSLLAAGVEWERLDLAALITAGWIALSALACLILQAALLLKWRRRRQIERAGEAVPQRERG